MLNLNFSINFLCKYLTLRQFGVVKIPAGWPGSFAKPKRLPRGIGWAWNSLKHLFITKHNYHCQTYITSSNIFHCQAYHVAPIRSHILHHFWHIKVETPNQQLPNISYDTAKYKYWLPSNISPCYAGINFIQNHSPLPQDKPWT